MKRTLVALFLALGVLPAAAKKHPPPRHPPPAPIAPVPDSPAPAPAAAPAPAPEPDAPPPAAPAAPSVAQPPPVSDDLEALRGEYDAIRDELFRSRARIGVVGEAVFKTKLVVDVDYKAQRDWPLKRLVAQLDDRQVFAEDNPQAGKAIHAYDSFAGAGRHVLAIQLESAGPEARAGFGVTSVFILDVVDGKQTRVQVIADEVGDGPTSLGKRRSGSYDVRMRADIRSEPLPPGAAGPPAKGK